MTGPLPALVAPGPELYPRDRARYSRHLLLPGIGEAGQRRLRAARVLVVGAGGLGSPSLLYLAAAGVGTIGIVDVDEVELSNLQRQVIHATEDVGRAKVDSARESILAIDESIDVRPHRERLTVDNAVEMFRGYDLVLDGTDNFATRYLVNDAAVLAGVPYVWGSIFRFEGQLSVFWEDAPDGRGLNYRDLYPEPPAPGTVPSCAEGGVLGVLPGVVGTLMATEAIKLICGIGDVLLGRLAIYDAAAMTMRTVRLARDPGRTPITGLDDYDAFCGTAPPGGAGADSSAGAADTVTATRLRDLLDLDEVVLVDVREPSEWDIVHIEGARLIPLASLADALPDLPRDRPVAVYCKTGIRSATALGVLRDAGFADAVHLAGGVLSWVRDVRPDLAAY